MDIFKKNHLGISSNVMISGRETHDGLLRPRRTGFETRGEPMASRTFTSGSRESPMAAVQSAALSNAPESSNEEQGTGILIYIL